jgi:hypothetical protein
MQQWPDPNVPFRGLQKSGIDGVVSLLNGMRFPIQEQFIHCIKIGLGLNYLSDL